MMSAVGWGRAVGIGRGGLVMGAVACAAGVAAVLSPPLRGEQEPQPDSYVIAFASLFGSFDGSRPAVAQSGSLMTSNE